MSKLIFFDIDGTLVNFDDVIPESAKKGLALAHDAGHKLFLCTGRGGSQVDKRLLKLPFDGMISSTGADVVAGERVIFRKEVPDEMLYRLVDVMEETKAYYALQGYESIIMNERSLNHMKARFREIGADDDRIETLFYGVAVLEDLKKAKAVEKAIYYDAEYTVPEVQKLLAHGFDVEPVSFDSPSDLSGEVTQSGINKAFGIKKLMEYYGIPAEDTVAFGDGPNDLDMLRFAGTGVAMGNAWDIVKETADLVTSAIMEDGIYNGLKELELI